jgi:hypothetical protein
VEDVSGVPLGDTLSDESDRPDLRDLESLEGRLVDGSRRGKVDEDIGVLALLDGLGDVREDGKEGLLGTPVESALRECIVS